MGKDAEETFETYLSKSGLGGEFGRIACLAYAIDDHDVEVLWGEEVDIVEGFWKAARGIERFVGHNIYDFDLPFIMKRSRILGVPPSWMPNFARYRQTPIYDTMREWELWANRYVALDTLAKALGLPTSKDRMSGADVASYFEAGRIEEICEYCVKDVVLTRHVYDKLTFGEAV